MILSFKLHGVFFQGMLGMDAISSAILRSTYTVQWLGCYATICAVSNGTMVVLIKGLLCDQFQVLI